MRKLIVIILACVCYVSATAQMDRKVQNRPYTDLRPFHFGVVVGTHLQDIELVNSGPQTITAEDGTTYESLVTCDQDRWDPGFTVGVLGEFRLSQHFQFRVAPAMYFGTRHVTFHNFKSVDPEGVAREQHQDIKTAYISAACDLIFAAPRSNNHRPYLMAGLNPMINLSGKDDDYIKLKRTDLYAEFGVGCDFYLPFFKLRPELKFMYSLTGALETGRAGKIRDKSMLPYLQSVKEGHTKIITLSFHFE